ncbi:hypothetical protein BH11MYX1_BH11MYX1_49010 [soil metagenome]
MRDEPAPPTPHYVIAPAPSVFPLGPVRGRIGRGVAPQLVALTTLEGHGLEPAAELWTLDTDGHGAYAFLGAAGSIAQVTLDPTALSWRLASTAPIVGASRFGVVCGDAKGTRTIDITGKVTWEQPASFVRMDGVRIAVAAPAGLSVVSAQDGHELYELALPAGARPLAVCDAETFVLLADNRLQKLVPGAKKPAFTIAVGASERIVGAEACTVPAAPILVTIAGERGTSLLAIARETGAVLGRVDDVRGIWPARGPLADTIEIATSTGVRRWDRALLVGESLELPPLGALLASHGTRRLVRATPRTAVLLDAEGIRAYLPISETTAVLGDTVVFTGSRLVQLPPRWQGPLDLGVRGPLAVPAELRDLPAPVTAPPPIAAPFDLGTKLAGTAIVGATLYVATDAGVAELDAATLAWGWHVAEPGARALVADATTIAFATERDVVILDRAGATRRRIAVRAVTLEVAGSLLIARTTNATELYDAATGVLLGRLGSDDGAPVRAAPLVHDGMELVVAYEHHRIVARLPRVRMLPVWSVDVAGVVATLERSGDGVLVGLEDGDAYRLDGRSGAATPIPGLGLAWRATGDAITGEAPGGPIPPAVIVAPAAKPEVYVPTDLEAAPAIATPWPPPPPLPASWELTVYDQAGGVRTRNDYAFSGVAGLRVGAAPFVYTAGQEALVIDSARGDPLRRVRFSGETAIGRAFSTIVDGRAIVGMILAGPLRLVVF